MKELDFDELDKAVNSLMANASSTPEQKSDPVEKVLEVPTTTAPSAPPVSSSPSLSVTPPARASVQAPVRPMPSSSTTPAARRGGRFMDVVHPSVVSKKEVTKPIAREAATIQPVQSSPAPSPDSKETVSVAPASASVPETPKSDWPDPLDMVNFSDGDKKKEESSKTVPVSPALASTEKDEEAPLVSPFLPDTKVEKRPLGGNASQNDAPVSVPVVENTDDQLPATLEDTKSLLPEEFHSELVAIEADTTELKEDEKQVTSTWTEPSAVKPEATKEVTLKEEKDKPPVPAGPGSIPQQYKEEKSTGDQENGAIYDTNSYHQPLSHPAKQKSGWMWVVWILLILVVGAGGGAALYFLGIIR